MPSYGGVAYGGGAYAGSYITGGNPFGNHFPTLIVEIGFGSNALAASPAWTDVTKFVQSVKTSRGRQHELNRFEAGTATITLDNRTGAFSPWNSSSAYYPNVKPFVPVRVRASWNGIVYPIYRGYIEAWPLKWEDAANSDVTVAAVDATKVLNLKRAASVNTTYASTILASSPYLYWRLGDAPNATFAADSSGNGRNGSVVTQAPTQGSRPFSFGASGAVIGDSDTALDCGAVGGMVQCTGVSFTVQNSTIELWMNWAAGQGGNDTCQVVNASASGITIIGGVDGSIAWVCSDGTNSTGIQTSGSGLNDGNWHHFALVVNAGGTSVQAYVDGIARNSASASPGAISNTAVNVYAGGGGIITWNGLIDEFVLYQSPLSASTVLSHYNAGARPREAELSGARITALLSAAGWPVSLQAIDAGNSALSLLGSDVLTRSVLDLCQTIADTEGGQLFMDASGRIVFYDRYHTSRSPNGITALTLGDSGTTGPGGESPYLVDTVDIQYDDTDLWNQTVVTPNGLGAQIYSDSASATTYGNRSRSLSTVDYSTASALGHAQADTNRYKSPLQRVRSVSFTPYSDADVLFPAALGFELLTRITFKRRPKDGAGSTFSQDSLIEGVEHDISPGSWTTTWRLSPTDASPVFWIIADPVAGKVVDGASQAPPVAIGY